MKSTAHAHEVDVPDLYRRPTIPIWPDAGRLIGLGRHATYRAVRSGEIPTIVIGGRRFVLTAALLRMLDISPEEGGPAA